MGIKTDENGCILIFFALRQVTKYDVTYDQILNEP